MKKLKTYLLIWQHRHGTDHQIFQSTEDWEMYYAEDNGEEDPEGLKAIKELGEKLGIDFEPERFDEYYSIERIYPDDAPVI